MLAVTFCQMLKTQQELADNNDFVGTPRISNIDFLFFEKYLYAFFFFTGTLTFDVIFSNRQDLFLRYLFKANS